MRAKMAETAVSRDKTLCDLAKVEADLKAVAVDAKG